MAWTPLRVVFSVHCIGHSGLDEGGGDTGGKSGEVTCYRLERIGRGGGGGNLPWGGQIDR